MEGIHSQPRVFTFTVKSPVHAGISGESSSAIAGVARATPPASRPAVAARGMNVSVRFNEGFSLHAYRHDVPAAEVPKQTRSMRKSAQTDRRLQRRTSGPQGSLSWTHGKRTCLRRRREP